MEHRVAKDALREGQMVEVLAGERKLLLLKADGEYRAYAARCPHYGAPLADGLLHDGRVLCPWHKSVFDALSGDLLQPPTLAALPWFPVRVEGGEVYVEVPEDAKRQRTPRMVSFDPDADPRTFAVIGGGAVGATAVAALREGGFRGRILMVSAEDRWPYDRPNLSKDYLAGEAGPDWLTLRPDSFYEEHDIERVANVVGSFDAVTRRIDLVNGRTMAPSAVLIAPGAEPRRLQVAGAGLPGVRTLRSRDDCDELIAAAKQAEHVVVVGASFIGMEVAAGLTHRGKDVVIVAPDEVPFAATLGPVVGDVLRGAHEARGARFRLGHRPAAILGEQRVTAVELDDGERLPADLVVVGIGVQPRTGFVHGLPREKDGGLRVDQQLRAAPGVWAGGDVASYPEAHVGERVRIEHWRLAEQHGRAAGLSMAGEGSAFDGVPFFWTQQAGVTLGFAGVGAGWTETIVSGDAGARDFTVFYCRDEQVRAACGTRDRELGVFIELMRAAALPPASALRKGEGLEAFL